MGLFGAAQEWGGKHGVQNGLSYLKSVTHTLQGRNLPSLYLTSGKTKKHMNQVTQSLGSAYISTFFNKNQQILLNQEMQISIGF